MGLDGVGDAADLRHEFVVGDLTAGGVAHHHVAADPARLGHSRDRYLGRVAKLAEDRHPDLRRQNPQLFHCGRSSEVGAHEERAAAPPRNQRASLAAAVVFPDP